MSQRLIQSLPPLLVIAVLCLTIVTTCAALEAPILQHKLDRFYFGAGTESAIYPGCRFHILCDTDTLTTGTIQQSLPGISYSHSHSGPMPSLPLDSCRAIIQPALIDSNATLTIAVPAVVQARHRPSPNGDSEQRASGEHITLTTQSGANVILIDSIPFIDAITSLQFEMIDAFLSYRDQGTAMDNLHQLSSPAPYIAVLIPNLSRAVNAETRLSTSLYYRFSAERLSLVFPGDRVLPLNCLMLDSANCPRPYPYDPRRGRQLLGQINPSVREVRLAVDDPSLERTGLLFVDVLARDRVSSTLLTGRESSEADLSIAWIDAPLGDLLTPLHSILKTLRQMNSNHPAHVEALDLVDRYLQAAADAPDHTGRIAYARLAAQRLSADLGVFALFRPRLYFHSRPNIVNFRFDNSGRPVFSSLERLLLPASTQTTQGGINP